MKKFHQIFLDKKLPLFLQPYEILLPSHKSAFIEFVHGSVSISSLREKWKCKNIVSLKQYFVERWNGEDSFEYHTALGNFVSSLAAYSLFCYFLSVKDRHDDNIMLLRSGHLCHIDFGHVLGSVPGNAFVQEPDFKMTLEYIELIGGDTYFKMFLKMMVDGFLALREKKAEILWILQIMHLDFYKVMDSKFMSEVPDNKIQEKIEGIIALSTNALGSKFKDAMHSFGNAWKNLKKN